MEIVNYTMVKDGTPTIDITNLERGKVYKVLCDHCLDGFMLKENGGFIWVDSVNTITVYSDSEVGVLLNHLEFIEVNVSAKLTLQLNA